MACRHRHRCHASRPGRQCERRVGFREQRQQSDGRSRPGTHVSGTIGAGCHRGRGRHGLELSLYGLKPGRTVPDTRRCSPGLGWVRIKSSREHEPVGGYSSRSKTFAKAVRRSHPAAAQFRQYQRTGDSVGYPAKFDSVIAAPRTVRISRFLPSTGPAVEIAAGACRLLCLSRGRYVSMSGTSMAPACGGCGG